jgi:ABC-type branched-subunit amino acid transport system substrate-binding protein
MNKFLKYLLIAFISLIHQTSLAYSEIEKIKIGLLVPMTGKDKNLGQQLIKATRMALNDIGSENLEIYPRDTESDPNKTMRSAIELKEMGINIILGPVFYKSLINLNKIEDVIFVSFTNKTVNISGNIISAGINATSQLNTIKKFIDLNEIKKTIFLTPKVDYEKEIKDSIKKSKLKISKQYIYDTEPTKLTAQIEKITNYKIRKQNLLDEIKRVENSDLSDKEKQLEKLKKRYTLGRVNFDSVIIADFDESLKSVVTSLLYTDVSPKKKYIISFNQWFDESILNEKNIQPLYYPSINKKNLNKFKDKYEKEFGELPSYLALLTYDLVGLVYYLTKKSGITDVNKLFKKETSFKGKIGIFDIENNKINHRLNFYKIENGEIKKIF